MTVLDLKDIQGLVARGYADLKAATYVLLRIDDALAAQGWLTSLADQITPAAARPAESALNVAFTAVGLSKLGLNENVLSQFSNEFTAGMTTPHRRRMLGDLGPNAPERWRWGGPSTPTPDILLLSFARDVDSLLDRHNALFSSYLGVSQIDRLDAFTDLNGKEHFGFTDGLSQPTVEGLSSRKDIPPNTLRAGEFVLGYENEYGLFTDRPLIDRTPALPLDSEGSGKSDLGRNGTYVVFRQLAQDVRGFWRSLDAAAPGDSARRAWLASRLVGRWPEGAPVTLSPQTDDPLLSRANDFTYAYADADGLGCPIGAHVRRSHPRDSLDPEPGTVRSVNLDKRHRLLRRGREYGPAVPAEELLSETPPNDPERGLFFICLAANIGRQFEFVQHSWVNNPKFASLYDEPDPLVGYRPAAGANFSIPADPVRLRLTNLPQFVTTRGGGYFFLPGLRALKWLSQGKTSSPVGS